jgi:hypothetical protein
LKALFESLDRATNQRFNNPDEQESEILLKRLRLLTSEKDIFEGALVNKGESGIPKKDPLGFLRDHPNHSHAYRYKKMIEEMDKDELRKVNNQSFSVIERCCGVLEHIEKSPIEHSYNGRVLLQLVIQQRCLLSSTKKSYCHDRSCLLFSSAEIAFPYSKLLTDSVMDTSKVSQTVNFTWSVHRIHVPTSSSIGNLYYNSKTNSYQSASPFDFVWRKHTVGLRKEKW